MEIGAALATAILIVRVAPRLTGVPIAIKVAHFMFVLMLTVLGADGFHIVTVILRNHHEYTIAFSNANPFGLSVPVMEYLGFGFALVGIVLCFAALRLGDFHSSARRTVICLAPPYCLLFPGMISTISDESRVHGSFHFTHVMTPILFIMSVGAVIFYSSKAVGRYLPFK
jgi:hypothetical protein